MIRAAALALTLAGSVAEAAETTYSVLSFKDLVGWPTDDHDAALKVFLKTCGDMKDPDWQAICKVAANQPAGRTFFELFFTPVLIQDGTPALFTGYFEPELRGSLTPTDEYRYPVYAMPPEARGSGVWLSRRRIEEDLPLAGRGLEIAWVDDPVELFFLQIQGSGRVLLPDGSHLRLGFAGSNGHKYRSIGVELVRRGIYDQHQVSAQVIRNWVRRNPVEGAELLKHNPGYVFFREVRDVSPEEGPKGAMNRSITEGRTVAIDPAYIPLGAPVWVEKQGNRKLLRLMIAQDTGSAIKGPQRADIFTGTGHHAWRQASRMKDGGRMVVLMPIQRAYAMMTELTE
ncbi:murein transglycosylase A [Pseudooceanicola aestuarii]|uniref:murein transglycosylase A n=1 Tax=Pseudooceanicola aestuarii TaxID=2697319 RepID=UPI0013D01C6A|nr:murein transglycosylase A [Pseudooceanicola aestuarii]